MTATHSPLRRVIVTGDGEEALRHGLLATLARWLPLDLDGAPEAHDGAAPAAVIRIGNVEAAAPAGASLDVAASSAGAGLDETRSVDIRFTEDEAVPFPFAGRTIVVQARIEHAPLALRPRERVLAHGPDGPIWTLETIAGVPHFRSAMPLANVDARQGFNDVFGGDRFLENLPLMHFLLRAVVNCPDSPPPLRAAFMFDDPNLHWPRYGFIDYLATAQRAGRENYHVAFATIPLDSWFSHARTAAIFREHPQALSLLIHGNNHVKHELARALGDQERLALLRQAVQRIERLERKAMLGVSRVMVPPHGACSEQMLQTLPLGGFESACISSGSLRAHNPGRPWTETLGFHPCESVAGCPVLPRWAFGSNAHNVALTAAYLGRPLIFRGHHADLKDGLEMLDSLAGFINGLGTVRWGSLSELSRMSYRCGLTAGRLSVTSFGLRSRIVLPESATELVVQRPHGERAMTHRVLIDGVQHDVVSGEPLALPAAAHGSIEIISPAQAAAPAQTGRQRLPRTSSASILRRVLTESRDRLMPQMTG